MKLAAVLVVALATSAHAQEKKPLTIEECLKVLAGLNALNCAGQQIGAACEKDAKQYKLGGARMTVALDIAALGPVDDAYRRGVQSYAAELTPIPPADPGKPDQFAVQRGKQNADFAAFQVQSLAKACPASPTHIRVTDLRVGDGADENAIPPAVLAALAPILDK